MDKSLAKGYTNQFIRDLKKNILSKSSDIDKLTKKISKKKNFIKILNDSLNSDWNNFSINHCSWGSKKVSRLGLTYLESNYYSHLDGGKELVLSGKSIIHTANPDVQHETPPFFIISHHVIQRIFERQKQLPINHYNKCFKLINEEFKYLTFTCFLWKIFEMNCFFDTKIELLIKTTKNINNNDKNNFIQNLKKNKITEEISSNINFNVPTDHGLILCDYKDNYINLRTYVTNEMLSKNQKIFRNNLLNISKVFLRDFFYLYNWFLNKSNKLFSITDDLLVYHYVEFIINFFLQENIKYLVKSDKKLEIKLIERLNIIVFASLQTYPILKDNQFLEELKNGIKESGLNEVILGIKNHIKKNKYKYR